MRILTIFSILLLYFQPVLSANDWKEGGVVFSSGETFEGKLNFYPEKQILVLEVNQTMKSFTAKKIKYFYIINQEDETRKNWFISKSKKMTKHFERHEFFEVLPYENITLFRQARKILKSSNSRQMKHKKPTQEIAYTYYLLRGDNLEKVYDFGQQVMPYIVPNSSSEDHIIEYASLLQD